MLLCALGCVAAAGAWLGTCGILLLCPCPLLHTPALSQFHGYMHSPALPGLTAWRSLCASALAFAGRTFCFWHSLSLLLTLPLMHWLLQATTLSC